MGAAVGGSVEGADKWRGSHGWIRRGAGQPWVDQARGWGRHRWIRRGGGAATGGSGEGVGQPQVANVSGWGR